MSCKKLLTKLVRSVRMLRYYSSQRQLQQVGPSGQVIKPPAEKVMGARAGKLVGSSVRKPIGP